MFRSLLMAALCVSFAGSALAQNYPAKPITYIFPFSPGPGDATLRPIFEKFRERTGQPIVIDFRPGAITLVGTQTMLRAPADGYTIGFTSSSALPANIALYQVPFTLDDFALITQVSQLDLALVVGPHVPANTIPEFIAWSKSRPGKQVNFANTSAVAKLMMNVMEEKTGMPYVEIPYKGTPEVLVAIAGGNADFHFLTLNEAATSLAKAGKIKILANSSEKRARDYPDVPTINEFVPGFQLTSWTGIFARAQVPKPIIDVLFRELTYAMKQPDVLQKQGVAARAAKVSESQQEFAQMVKRETDLYVRTAKAAGVVPQPLN